MLKKLNQMGVSEVPIYYDHGTGKDNVNYLIMELVPNSIETAFVSGASQKETIKEMISCLQKLHEAGYIHRDIKPDAFRLTSENKVKIMDFSISRSYYSNEIEKIHITPANNSITRGSAAYCSRYSHQGEELSRRDDLESLAYALFDLLKYSLPWMKD